MAKFSNRVQWKDVDLGEINTTGYRLQVSNQGNLRAFNQFSAGSPLMGSIYNCYRIIRLKLFKPKDKKTMADHTHQHTQIVTLRQQISDLLKEGGKHNEQKAATYQALLQQKLLILRTAKRSNAKARTIHYHALIHRLVAHYFLPAPSADQTVVGHLDHNKLNNTVSNLRWMTPKENYDLQQLSPLAIKMKKDRIKRSFVTTK